jgi:hypothetical protein
MRTSNIIHRYIKSVKSFFSKIHNVLHSTLSFHLKHVSNDELYLKLTYLWLFLRFINHIRIRYSILNLCFNINLLSSICLKWLTSSEVNLWKTFVKVNKSHIHLVQYYEFYWFYVITEWFEGPHLEFSCIINTNIVYKSIFLNHV